MNGDKQAAPEREKLQQEVETQKAVAGAWKDLSKVTLEKLKTQLPEGKVTTNEKSGYLAELVAYDSLLGKAGTIAEEIQMKLIGKARILIVDTLDFCGPDVQLLQVSQQLDYWGRELQAQGETNEGILQTSAAQFGELEFGLPVAGAVLGAAPLIGEALATLPSLVGLFQVDYDVKGREVKVSDLAFRAQVANKLTCPVFLSQFHMLLASPLVESLRQNIEKRLSLRNSMARLKSQLLDPIVTQIDSLKSKVAALSAEIVIPQPSLDSDKIVEKTNEKTKLQEEIQKAETQKKQISDAYIRSETLIKEFDEFNKNLTMIPEGKSMSLLATVAMRQYWEQRDITHLLYLTTVSVGGESITARRFWKGAETGFLGGGVVTYILAKTSGEIVAANTLVGLGFSNYRIGQDKVPVFEHS